MTDRDKTYLLKELTRTINESDSTAAFCLCQRWILKDALALLKEQRPVEPLSIKQEMFDEYYGAVACCPKCNCMWIMYIDNDMHYCPECGQAVKWE